MRNDFLVSDNSGNQYVRDFRAGKIKLGDGVGCPDFDAHIRGKRGAFNVILGHRNTGKTAWVNFYNCLLTVAYGYRQLIYTPENSIGNYKRDIVQYLTGMPIKMLDVDTLEKVLKFIEFNYKFVNPLRRWSAFEILEEATQFQDKHDNLIIDPYNSLAAHDGYRSMNKHDYDYECASRMRVYCESTKNTIYLPMHATTESLRRVHKNGFYAGMFEPPRDGDAEGGGKWSNRCDDFIIVHRYTKSPTQWMNTFVSVDKVKDTATGGKPTSHDEAIIFKMDKGVKFLSLGRVSGYLERGVESNTQVDLMAWAKAERRKKELYKIDF